MQNDTKQPAIDTNPSSSLDQVPGEIDSSGDSEVNQDQTIFAPEQKNMAAGQKVTTFLLGGTPNVSRFMTTTKASLVFYWIWLGTLLCIIGMSALRYRYGYTWLQVPFLIAVAFSAVNVLYFGWIRRELVYTGRGIIPINTLRGGTAFAYSFFYLAGIVIFAAVGWNFARVNGNTPNTDGVPPASVRASK